MATDRNTRTPNTNSTPDTSRSQATSASRQNNSNTPERFGFVFGKINYILMVIGLVVLALGYILLCGGGSDDPNVFNYDMFNTRRLVVAPIMIIAGFIVEIFAIMIKSKKEI